MSVIWITGAHGFIGHHLALAASESGALVAGLGHGAWPEVEAKKWGLRHWLNGDITQANLDLLAKQSGVPDIIYHLAGGSSVGLSIQAPEEDFYRTVISAASLLEWVRLRNPSSRLVLASSAAVYGAAHSSPIQEDGLIEPYSPYGYHKRSAELLFESYARNYGLSTSIVRSFSVYGSGLRKQLLWDICGRLQASPANLTLGGSGNEVRDFIHVKDAIAVLLTASQYASQQCFAVNGGTGQALSVREVAGSVCNAWGLNLDIQFSGQSREGDPEYLVADISKVTSLGLACKVAWVDGIADYVQWYKRQANLRGAI